MIKSNTDKIEKAQKLFLLACLSGKDSEIKSALATEININACDIQDGYSAAMYLVKSPAPEGKKIELLELFFARGDFDKNHRARRQENLLMVAAATGSLNLVNAILPHYTKSLLQETDNDGNTAINFLLKKRLRRAQTLTPRDQNIISRLIEVGVDPQKPNYKNENYATLHAQLARINAGPER